jgi:SAM-dependent methyltransferase
MKIDTIALKKFQTERPASRKSEQAAGTRAVPSRFAYDFPALDALALDIRELLELAREAIGSAFSQVLDIGSDSGPYRKFAEDLGFSVRTMDLDSASGPDLIGRVEETGLPSNSLDGILCTQVLEHCDEPWTAAREFSRVVKPGGFVIVSVPHVWFYHPHPNDNWRFTPEGLVRLFNEHGLEVVELRLQGGTILCCAQILNFCLFGIAGRLAAPVYFVVGWLGKFLDRLLPNPLFPLNVAVLLRKPPKSAFQKIDSSSERP